MSQLNDNLGADAFTFAPDDLAALNEATKPQSIPLDWLELTMDDQAKNALAPKL